MLNDGVSNQVIVIVRFSIAGNLDNGPGKRPWHMYTEYIVEDRVMAIQAQQLSILWTELDLAWSQLICTCVSVYLSCGW